MGQILRQEEEEMNELISIIVPVYNAEKYLDRGIQSIINQSYRNLEILLIDDGSTDSSFQICQDYAGRDPRIQVFQKENGGVSSARNFGLSQMTGQWFMTMDADDYMAEDAILMLYEAVKQSQADMAIGGFEMVYEDGSPRDRRAWKNAWSGTLKEFGNELLVPFFDLQLIHNCNNKLYRAKSFWGRRAGWEFESPAQQAAHILFYDEMMWINEDVWFSARMITRTKRICVVPQVIFYYWQHQAGDSLISRFNPNGVETCFPLLKAIQGLLRRSHASEDVQNQMNNRMVFHICGFAGLAYHRSGYSRRQCYEEIKKLAARPEFCRLLVSVKPEGLKNRLAVLVLRCRLIRIYHWMCLALYGRQRRAYFKSQKGQR